MLAAGSDAFSELTSRLFTGSYQLATKFGALVLHLIVTVSVNVVVVGCLVFARDCRRHSNCPTIGPILG